MKSRFLFVFLIINCAQIFWSGEVWGQTYTTTGVSTNWNDASAWVRSGECGAINNEGPPPPRTLNSGNACAVKIIINHLITFSGSTSFGGGYMDSLIINSSGILTITGNLTINNVGNNVGPFAFKLDNGGRMIVNNSITLDVGATITMLNTNNISPKTRVTSSNLTIGNNGSGSGISVGENTEFEVTSNTVINNGNAYLNLKGSFISGQDLTVGSNGNDSGDRISISGEGKLIVGRDANISRHIKAIDNSSITIHVPGGV